MKKEIIKRVEEVSDYIIETKKTIRETAKKYKISKSTVHKDIKERLKELDLKKYNQIEIILKKHIETRHIIGGQSTKQRYEQLKLKNEG